MPALANPLGQVVLISAAEEFLAQRYAGQIRQAILQLDPEAELSATTADQLTMATLGELAAPSLFSSVRCVVVEALENLPAESVKGLVEYAAAPASDVTLVLIHNRGNKGSGTVRKLKEFPHVIHHEIAAMRGNDYPRFVIAECRELGQKIDASAANYLVQAIGQDVRALAGACHQLVTDAPDQDGIGVELVKLYFGGRAEAKSYDFADRALSGNVGATMEELRWALDLGTSPVMLTAAVATSLRQLTRVAVAGASQRGGELARYVGAPAWKIRQLQQQAQAWSQGGLQRALTVVAAADAAVKGATNTPEYALEKMVLQLAAARRIRSSA